jgi:cyclopropane fatty-acyl-phospholipid synthase-like methyltransferase
LSVSRSVIAVILIAGMSAGLTGRQIVTPTQPQRRPDVRYLPTPQNVVDAMLELAHVTSADVVYDLGSGDGRIPITAAQRYGARGVGIELDPALVGLSRDNARKAGVDHLVTFIEGDLFKAEISQATVVALFLLPGMNIDLIPKFRSQLRPGSRIVAHHFAMGDSWPPDESRDINGLMIYVWNITP